MLDRQHLLILKAVHTHGSLTAAARALCLTQPALTHAIKKLERYYGAIIWQKQGRTLQLTQAGLSLLNLAHRVLPQFEYAEDTLKRVASGGAGELRIGMECHPCYRWLLKIVEPYLSAWPEVDIDIKQQFAFGGVGALFNYDIDVLVTPDPFTNKGLTFVPVFDYEHVLVIGQQHPLSQKQTAAPKDLLTETLITYPVEPTRLDEDTDIILQMVAANRGVSALPKWLVLEYQGQLPIACLPLGPKGIHKSVHLGLRAQEASPKYLAAFIELAQKKTCI